MDGLNRAARRAQARKRRHATARRVVVNAAQVTLAAHQEARPQAVIGLMLELHECFDALKCGSTDRSHFDRLAGSLNTALVLAERIGQDAVDVILAGHDAMHECAAIFERHGKFGFSGAGIGALVDALDVYGQIVRLSTPRQIMDGVREGHRRVRQQMREAACSS